MTNQNTKEYLNYFVTSQNPNFAVMLKGKWGAGKTYFIRGIMEEWENAQVIADNEINLRPIYISLNGISKKGEIIDSLKAKISPFLYSKGVKFARDIVKGFFKSTLKIDFDYDSDEKSDGNININFDPISIFKSSNDKIKGNRILIFDDIERCKIPIDELYGFINDFVEHSECKVILISDEEKLDEENTKDSKFKYPVFKEKIVGQTFEIKPDTEQAVDFFFDSLKCDMKPYLLELKDVIINIFDVSKKENLRVLQRAIYEFERLFSFTETELKKDEEKYKILIKNFLSYFLIYFLEFKTGNEDISSFQQKIFLSDNQNEKRYTQYEEIVATFSLIHTTRLFTPPRLIEFIKNGDSTGIVDEINNSIIYARDREEKDWEKLWAWRLLNDDEFSILLDSVSKSFFTTEVFHITEILHISGILFTLIDSKLYKSKDKNQVVNRAKHLIEKTDLSPVTSEKGAGFSILTWGSWQKEYASDKSLEFKSLIEYTREIAKLIRRKKSDQIIEDIFYNITDENVEDLYKKTRDYNDGLENIIEKTPMLSTLDPKKFAQKIFKLNNETLVRLTQFIEYRFFPEKTYVNLRIEDFHRQEKDFLLELQLKIANEIKSKKNQNMPIRELTLTELNQMIEKSIKRL